MNISRWISWWAGRTPNKVAIRFAGNDLTYAEFANETRRAAGVLRSLGVSQGDRIAYLGYNSPEFLILLFACARIGAMMVPLNIRLAPAEHLYMLENAGAKVFFFDPRFLRSAQQVTQKNGACRLISTSTDLPPEASASLPHLMQTADPDVTDELAPSDSPLLIVYTSGTTGKPKGAVLTQLALHWNGLNSQVMHDLRRSDHILTTLPFFHVGGLNIQTTPALLTGATVTLIEKFHAGEFLKQVAQDRPTLTVLVPTQMQAIVQHPQWHKADLSSLRCVTTGSTMVQVPLLDLWHEHGIPVVQVYGCTESGPIAIHQILETAHDSPGSIGRPALNCEVRVVDEYGRDVPDKQPGEFLLRGSNILKEYWRDPQATGRSLWSGWFYTGDIGYRDHKGDYFIIDRKKRVIISGGENIYPSELESILLEHPAIREAVVVGHPHDKWGEVPAAVMVCDADDTPDITLLKSLFEERIGHLKHPHHYVFLDALPRNAMGKVVYEAVQSQVATFLSSPSSPGTDVEER